MADILEIAHLCLALSIPFLFGVVAGIEIAKRSKQAVENEEARLGREFMDMIDRTATPIRFAGDAITVTTATVIRRKGVECRLTLEARADG